MATKRCIPVRFFKNPDVADLSKDCQLILIGLALSGDDDGRGVADTRLLGREIDYPPEQMEVALKELEAHELIVLYQVGRHRYYQITEDWQKSMGARKTPSKLPAPAAEMHAPAAEMQPQSNLIKSNLTEDEEKSTPDSNVLVFPHIDSSGGGGLMDDVRDTLTEAVADILKLPVTPALARVVADFLPDTAISLTGEADAAREYIDDPRRNHRHKTMTPAFYRQWLKRERDQKGAEEGRQRPTAPHQEATGTTGLHPPPGLASRSLMHLEAEYQGHKPQQKGNKS